MTNCCVYGCSNNTSTTEYLNFPENPELIEKWLQATGWPEGHVDPSTAHICTIHFSNDSFTTVETIINSENHFIKILNDNAVPTLYIPRSDSSKKECPSSIKVLIKTDPNNDEITIQLQEEEPQTDIKSENRELYETIRSYDDLNKLQAKNNALRMEIHEMRQICNSLNNELKEIEKKITKYDDEPDRNNHGGKNEEFTSEKQNKVLSKVFSKSQIKILSGKRKIWWSDDDMAVGYTIRHLSNKRFYQYLTKDLNIPLPAVSSIKRWVSGKNKGSKGDSNKETEETESTT